MTAHLTDKQKELARWIADNVAKGVLDESFHFATGQSLETNSVAVRALSKDRKWLDSPMSWGSLEALNAENLVRIVEDSSYRNEGRTHDEMFFPESTFGPSFRCTVTGALAKAVQTNFAEEGRQLISSLAQPHPPEIAMSLDRLRGKYPDAKRLGFLVMRFTAAKPFGRTVEVIKETAAKYEIEVIRADENEFHADLWGNVRTHLHGCGFGIAVYERIETEEPNANVGLEIGYLMAMNKPVLLLKDKTVPTLQADLAGKLYKPFDPHDPESTIPKQLTKWLEDNGIALPIKKPTGTEKDGK